MAARSQTDYIKPGKGERAMAARSQTDYIKQASGCQSDFSFLMISIICAGFSAAFTLSIAFTMTPFSSIR